MTREEQLFNEALALPPAERAEFLVRACTGDDALHQRIAELLAAHDDSAGFFAQSVLPSRPLLVEEKPGDIIGRYTLMRKLGEGGCGVVYLAEQREPVRRQVALKVIKVGMDTREVITRFEAERQALALMDHTNIARVYDAGATDAGRPYFVMEFVDGVPITQFCDAQNLSVPDRLRLFADLCQALQHAHQKGVIHRDIKPSNVLVARQDGAPVPKIIDFGIAKATQGRLTEHTFVTRFEQVVGTPAYMSPEQADLRDTDIDTRSDIYSLGVLLYELLTGRPPFDPKSLLQAGLAEIRRIIRETEPPRPSTVVSTLGHADRTIVAQHRRASSTRLPSELRGDLDWIVMRCLEKQRDRRYGTAAELAADIQRHLDREPVTARPPSAAYRTRKFISRHRFACSAIAAVALALIAGAVVSTWQAVRATRAEQAARLAQGDAQRRQEQAEALLAFMLGDFRDDLKKVGQLALLERVGNKALDYFETADPRDLTDMALARNAKALSQIGEVKLALKDIPFAEAEKAFQASYARAAELAARHPADGEMLFERAQAEYWIGRTHRLRGTLERAAEWYGRYLKSAEALVALEPKNLKWQQELVSGRHNLASLDLQRSRFNEARAGFLAEREDLRRLAEAHPEDTRFAFQITDVESYLGSIAERTGDLKEASHRFAEQTRGLEALVKREPQTAHWTYKLADSLSWEAEVFAITGQRERAEARNRQAENVLQPLLSLDAANRRWLLLSLQLRLRAARLAAASGDTASALRTLTAIRGSTEKLAAAEPANVVVQVRLMNVLRLESFLLGADAVSQSQRAMAIGARLDQQSQLDDQLAGDFALARIVAGQIGAATGDNTKAAAEWQAAVDRLQPFLPRSRDWRVLDPAIRALTLLGRPEVAKPLRNLLEQSSYVPLEPWPEAPAFPR